MELILDNVTYKGNNSLEYLNNISYSFKEGINFLVGLDASLLKKMLFQEIKIHNGYVMVNVNASKKDVYLVSFKEDFYKNSILEEANYLNELYNLGYENINDRINKALVMVGLNKYGDSYFSDLSSSELKKIKLAMALYVNAKIIILDNMEKGFSSKDIEYLRKLLRKISKMYNKNIIICSNNLDSYLDIVDKVIIIDKGKIVVDLLKEDLYNDNIYKYIKMPKVIYMIKYLEKNGHKFDNYIEMKELLKAIYRDVENK